jgi:hypothetical protein
MVSSLMLCCSYKTQVHWVELDRIVEHDRATATLFGINRIRYMSASRSRYLYELQKSIMKSLHVPFLDLYEGTYLSSDRLYPSDGRHYRPELNRKMIGWFFSKQDCVLRGQRGQTTMYYSQVSL